MIPVPAFRGFLLREGSIRPQSSIVKMTSNRTAPLNGTPSCSTHAGNPLKRIALAVMSSPTTPSRSGDLSELLINVDRDLKLGVKRATSILDAIEATRSLTLSQFLGSLGLDHLGKRRVELMINAADGALDDLEAWRCGSLRDASFAAAAGVPSIGSEIQDGIDSMAVVIDKLLKAGVTVKSLNEEGGATLAKTICISGKLYSGYKKSDYLLPLRKIGYALVDEVTKGLNFLVLADIDSGSSKAEKAKKLGVSVISESQLIDMISLIASAPPDSLLESSLLRVNEPKPPMEIAMSNATKPLVSDSASRRFEFVDEKSSKFWEVKVVSGSVEVRLYRLGLSGHGFATQAAFWMAYA